MNDYKISYSDLLYVPKYLLFRSHSKTESSHTLYLNAGLSKFKIELSQKTYELLLNLLTPSSPEKISDQLKVPLTEVIKTCEYLLKNKIIFKYEQIPTEIERYNRNLIYYSMNFLNPIDAQKKLSKLTITLIGMGGIGNWISLNLSGLGINKLRIIDHDVIEESNICRQTLFMESHIGKKKVHVAKEMLLGRNSTLNIEVIDSSLTEINTSDVVKGSDFVVLSADSPAFYIQKWVNKACIENLIPFFNVGYSNGTGVIGPLVIPHQTACLSCQDLSNPDVNYKIEDSIPIDLLPLVNHYQAPSFVCLNSLVSSLASYEIVKYFLKFGQCESIGHRLFIDPLTYNIDKRSYTLNKNCQVCRLTQK